MAKLSVAARKKIPKEQFGLPEQRKYPMPDRKHAQVAEAYAERYATPAEKAKIDRKADRVLGRKRRP